MTREAMINTDALNPLFIKYNPCYYCKRTLTCEQDCPAKIGFLIVLENRLSYLMPTEQALEQMVSNARKYKLPVEDDGY